MPCCEVRPYDTVFVVAVLALTYKRAFSRVHFIYEPKLLPPCACSAAKNQQSYSSPAKTLQQQHQEDTAKEEQSGSSCV
jgi:hypothetical protein